VLAGTTGCGRGTAAIVWLTKARRQSGWKSAPVRRRKGREVSEKTVLVAAMRGWRATERERPQSVTQGGREAFRGRGTRLVGRGTGEPSRTGDACSGRASIAGSRAIPGRAPMVEERNGRKSSRNNQGDPPGPSGVSRPEGRQKTPGGVRASVVSALKTGITHRGAKGTQGKVE